MWVELSSNFCHLSNIIQPLLRTNLMYKKPTVVFSPHTPCGRVRLAVHTRGSRLRRFPPSENDCFAVYNHSGILLFTCKLAVVGSLQKMRFWTFWCFLSWISAKLASIQSKIRLQHNSLPFLPPASRFTTLWACAEIKIFR